MARVVLAMSGGVDSSVAAHLLVEQGHEVIGVFMRHGHESPAACAAPAPDGGGTASLPIIEPRGHKQGCCTATDAEDARRVADHLGVPFYALNLDREFGRIIDYFVNEYAAGRTPNPCVQCNNWIKFGKLFDYADAVGAEFVATGHYARVAADGVGRPALLRGHDDRKDQSYVLFGVRPEYLSRMMLPVGQFAKPAIRELAESVGLAVAAKKDSQEICFVTRGRYDDFVRAYRRREADADGGELVLSSGEVVGEHGGVEGFTVGQRKGLGVALGAPKFVLRIEPETRRVVLGDHEELGRTDLAAADCNWLVDIATVPGRRQVQVRYNSAPADAMVELDTDGRMRVRFDEPQFNVAPGQAAVCYDGPRVLGGGWIE